LRHAKKIGGSPSAPKYPIAGDIWSCQMRPEDRNVEARSA